jgi:hypothetical protein
VSPSYAQHTARFIRACGELIESVRGLIQNDEASALQSKTGVRRHDFASGSQQERHPKLLLEPSNLLAHYCFGNPQALSCVGERTSLHDHREVRESIQVHGITNR